MHEQHKEAWITFSVAHAVLSRTIDRELLSRGLPGLEVYEVLLTLAGAPEGRLRMSDLADHVMLSRSGITRLVDRLESEQLLVRHRCPADRRATYAVITEQGRELRERMWDVYRESVEAMFSSKIDCEEAAVLIRVFHRLLDDTPKELLHGLSCPGTP